MTLNFLTHTGYATHRAAQAKLERFVDRDSPITGFVASFIRDGFTRYQPVVVVNAQSMHLARHLAEHDIYVVG